MLVFINGSINAGKTTVSKLVAQKIEAEFIDFDDLNDTIPNFDLKKDIPKTFELGVKKINELNSKGNDVVANYVVRDEDWVHLLEEIDTNEKYLITLAPRLDVALTNRGTRELTEWEIERIKYHYDTGIPTPKHGVVIDNSDLTAEETVDKIIGIIKSN